MSDEMKQNESSSELVKNSVPASQDSRRHSGPLSNNSSLTKPKSIAVERSVGGSASTGRLVVEVTHNHKIVTRKGLRIFGTNDDDSNNALANQVLSVVSGCGGDLQNLNWALSAIRGICPEDELEGLLAAQMICVHSLAMKSLSRASQRTEDSEVTANVNEAIKLMRTFTSQMEALSRHRGSVVNPMVVKSVNINDGGQAIVGQVNHPHRGGASTEDEPRRGK